MNNLVIVKKHGMQNEDGKIIIPAKYKKIKLLKSGIYVAKKFSGEIHLYTKKGQLSFSSPIWYYKTDKNENIVALKTTTDWKLIDIDYQKNKIEIHYSGINYIINIAYGYIAAKVSNDINDNSIIIYSIRDRLVIINSWEACEVEIYKQGFVFFEKDSGLQSFYNLSGRRILDYKWTHIELYSAYILVKAQKSFSAIPTYGIFSYEGEPLISCKYRNLELENIKIGESVIPLFKVGKIIGSSYKMGLLMLNGEALVVFGEYDEISIEGDNFIITRDENSDILYEVNDIENDLQLKFILKGKKITVFDDNATLFKVSKRHRVGLYSSSGEEIIPAIYKNIQWKKDNSCIIATSFWGNKKEISLGNCIES